MDLLAGYGSGSESDSEPDVRPASNGALHSPAQQCNGPAAAVPKAGLLGSLPKPMNAAPGAGGDNSLSGLPAGFFDVAPAAGSAAHQDPPLGVPSGFFDQPTASAAAADSQQGRVNVKAPSEGAGAALFSKLPAASRRKVLLRPQIDLQLLAQQSDSDDDEPVAKKIKAAGPAAGKSSILSFLPAPKNTAGKRMDTGSGSSASGGAGSGFAEAAAAAQAQQQRQRQQQQEAPAAVVQQGHVGNEAYRLRPAAVGAAAAAGAYGSSQQHHYSVPLQEGYGQYEQTYPEDAAAAGTATWQQQQQSYQQLPPEEAFLQEALQAEASKAARRAAGAGSSQLMLPDIQFKEVKADDVKHVDPAQREAAQGMRSALGSDYAQQLRSQAAPHTGSKLARSKHQIGTLFANAKLRELEVLENRASGMKSKAETAGKYGW